jgi:MFS transporter, DHA1 family, multidrug resistance protein
MAGPFWMLYAAEFKGASAMVLAYMVSTRGLTNVVFSPFIGRLTDTIGRKKMIIGGRILMYAATGLMLFSNTDWLLILAWLIMGASDATGVAWQAEEIELVNHNQRSRMTAISVGSFNLLAVPASILGGYLWDNVSPIAPFVVMAIIDGFIRMPAIYFRIPEGNHPVKSTRV